MKSKKIEIKTLTAEEIGCDLDKIGLTGSPTIVNKAFSPPQKTGGEMIIGKIWNPTDHPLRPLAWNATLDEHIEKVARDCQNFRQGGKSRE